MKEIQQKISYQFKDFSLLKLALTHRSASIQDNERLEFLGDSVLGIVISLKLYKLFPNIKEGKLSRLRSYLVRGQTLAKLTLELGLSEHIILGASSIKSFSLKKESLYADVLEAIFGAILIDSDFITINNVILNIYKQLLADINPDDSLKDAKTELQEYLQKKGSTLPNYIMISSAGKEHDAVFTVNCLLVDEKIQVQNEAKSIKIAEQLCAQNLLDKIKNYEF